MIDYTLVERIDEMLAVQIQSAGDSEYMRGMYNGMEFVRSMASRSEPIYVDESGDLDKEAVKRNPERYI